MTMAKNPTAISDVIASGVMSSCRAWPDNKRETLLIYFKLRLTSDYRFPRKGVRHDATQR